MKRTLTIFLLFILIACGENIDLPSSPDLIVVEGWIYDQDTIQKIRLSKTAAFGEENEADLIENATIAVKSTFESYSFSHSENGIYYSNEPFAAKPGRFYHVEINVDGKIIRSMPEQMKQVPPIDTLTYDSFTEPSETNPQVEIIVYYPVAFISDDQEENNYYRWRFWKNQTLFNTPEDIFIQSDRFFNGLDSIENEFIDFDFRLNDTIQVELQEISFNAYSYLRLLKLQTTSLGTRQGTSPAAINGNLFVEDDPSEIVLGFFGTISTTTTSTVINP